MAAPTLEIAGVDRTAWLQVNSARYSRSINGRARCSAVLEDIGRGYAPSLGNSFVILQDGIKRFAGPIREIETYCHPPLYRKQFTVSCLDFNSIADKRRIQAEYLAPQTFENIVGQIVGSFLDNEGVTTGGVAAGPTILEDVRFNYNSVAEAFNKLSQITGNYGAPFLWFIDFDKVLHFSQFASNPAPFSITDNSDNFFDFRLLESLDNYRNDQYVRTEYDLGAVREETTEGDGVRTTFWTAAVITETPTVYVGDVQQTVGEFGVDHTGKAFYWIRDGIGVFNQDHATLTAGQFLTVQYASQSANVVRVTDDAQVAFRAAAEGGSGRYQAVDEQKNISTLATLRAIGQGDLQQWGSVPQKPQFTVYRGDMEPGQRVPINLTRHGINAEYFIEEMSTEWVAAHRGGRADFLKTRIRCTSVPAYQMRTGYIEKLTEMARIGSDPGTVTGTSTPTITGCTGWGETPSGAMNGSNTSFTLAEAPLPPASLVLALNGIILRQGTDYTLSGNTISYAAAPASTDQHRAWYGFGYSNNSEILGGSSPADGIFSLAATPAPPLSLILALNGVVQLPGSDFTLSGNTVDYVTPPDGDDWQRAWYGTSDTGITASGESPSGTVNGSNKAFTLVSSPTCVLIVRNGVIQFEGIDFTIDGPTITFLAAPLASDWIRAWYKL